MMLPVLGRAKWIAIGVVAVLGFAAVDTFGTWWYVEHRHPSPGVQIYDTAEADAAKKVTEVVNQFTHDHTYKADDYAHSAAQHADVQVLTVTGQTRYATGVTMVLKVKGEGEARRADGAESRAGDVAFCFRLQLGPKKNSRDDDIDCPPGTPWSIALDPSLYDVDDHLRAALQSAGPHESAVRTAVAGLHLDPAIHQDYAATSGTVGVALQASQFDCVIARVTSKDVQLWRPSHIQMAPGELNCNASIALGTEFNTYPH
jgi:hypothetical protein